MTLLFQRKKATVVESPGGANAFPFDIISVHTQNGANQSQSFTNAAGDRFVAFAINAAAATPVVLYNGSPQAVKQTATTTNGYGTMLYWLEAVDASFTLGVNGVGVGSSVIFRLRLKAGAAANGQLSTGMPSMLNTSADTATIAAFSAYVGAMIIVWDRDVESPNPVNQQIADSELLHDFTYTYFRGKLVWKSSVAGNSSVQSTVGPTSLTALKAVYGTTACAVAVR